MWMSTGSARWIGNIGVEKHPEAPSCATIKFLTMHPSDITSPSYTYVAARLTPGNPGREKDDAWRQCCISSYKRGARQLPHNDS